jgi:predicted nuclease of predicted toxin-antitoxin system
VKILLDECVDRRLAREISEHDVNTVPQMGWAGIKNGDLLTLAQKQQFEVFVTVDRNLSFQQNLTHYNIAVIVLRCRTNRLRDLRLLVPELTASLPSAKRGDVLWIGNR